MDLWQIRSQGLSSSCPLEHEERPWEQDWTCGYTTMGFLFGKNKTQNIGAVNRYLLLGNLFCQKLHFRRGGLLILSRM